MYLCHLSLFPALSLPTQLCPSWDQPSDKLSGPKIVRMGLCSVAVTKCPITSTYKEERLASFCPQSPDVPVTRQLIKAEAHGEGGCPPHDGLEEERQRGEGMMSGYPITWSRAPLYLTHTNYVPHPSVLTISQEYHQKRIRPSAQESLGKFMVHTTCLPICF